MAGKAKKDDPEPKGKKGATDGDEGEDAPKKGGKLKLIIIIVAALLVLGGGGGGAYFFLFAGDDAPATADAEPAPASFLEVKPFVVTIRSTDGGQHYLQLGMSMKVPTADAATAIGTVMPMVLDAMRQTILAYKTDELETGEGVNKLRGALVGDVNDVLVKSLGAGKIKKLGDDSGKSLVQNIFFSSLVIE